MGGHFWLETGYGGPKGEYPLEKFQIFFLKSFVNVSIGKVKKFQPLTLSRSAVIDIKIVIQTADECSRIKILSENPGLQL